MDDILPGLDLVVVNYRTPQDLHDFVESLCRHLPTVDFSLVVANVDPTAADEEVGDWAVKQLPFTSHVTFTDNVGYARACNTVANFGSREIVALFNADVRLAPHALDECYWALLSNPDWGVLGPRQVDDRGHVTHAGIFGTRERPTHRAWRTDDLVEYRDIRDDAVTVSGAAYFVKRTVWEELGNCPVFRQVAPHADGAFLPTQHYYEETWCSYHAIEHGWKVVYFGPVGIVHRWHQASPVGGHADQLMPQSQQLFRQACAAHDIPCD